MLRVPRPIPGTSRAVTPPPPAPWRCDMRAVVWLQPVPGSARAALAGPIAGHRWLPLGIAGLVAYRETPVGPYGELFAALATLDGVRPLGHVPFMAVDSAASVAGGRGNWALPKELVRFERGAVHGDGWSAAVAARARRPVVPLAGAGRGRQAWPDGVLRDFLARFTGRAGPATVTVGTAGEAPLPRWLSPGAYPALILDGLMDVLPPDTP